MATLEMLGAAKLLKLSNKNLTNNLQKNNLQ